MHKELASEPSWKPTELASEAALAIDMAVRVAAREIGRLDLSPQAWAAMLGEAAIAIAEGAAACAPGQSEGRVDRAMRAACFQAAKHDSLCEAHEGGRVASREAKRILAKAAAERASLAGAWSGESRSAMLGALSEVEWRRRWRGDGPAPWEDPAAAPPPDWSPWEVEAAKLAGTAMPRIKELRAIAAAPKWRAGDFAALGSGSGLALGIYVTENIVVF